MMMHIKGHINGFRYYIPGWPFLVATVVFVIFKLMGNIVWSWWLVFSPILGFGALGILVFALTALYIRMM